MEDRFLSIIVSSVWDAFRDVRQEPLTTKKKHRIENGIPIPRSPGRSRHCLMGKGPVNDFDLFIFKQLEPERIES